MNDTLTPEDIEIGETYSINALPENEMNNSGKLEWVGDNLLALSTDGKLIEFKMAVECTAVCNVTEDGDIEVLKGSTKR